MDTLWDRPLPIGRDRTGSLHTTAIAHCAFAIADAENLAAVTVKRVAGRLGVTSSRLQQYLHSRADLLDLMLDVALGDVEIEVADRSWSADLTAIAHAVRALVGRHPWLVALLGQRPPSGPNGLAFSERCLVAVCASGMDVARAALCVETVITYVCGSVRQEPASVRQKDQSVNSPEDYLSTVVTESSFPRLARVLAQPQAISREETFEFGLACLLDGMVRRVDLATAMSPTA